MKTGFQLISTRSSVPVLGAFIALALAIPACSSDEATPPPATTDAGTTTTQLRVVHASPDAPAVDVYAKGVTTPLFTNVKYGQATGYIDVAEATRACE